MNTFTTIQIPKDVRDLVKTVAQANERSIASQIAYWAKRELLAIQRDQGEIVRDPSDCVEQTPTAGD